MSIFSGKDGLTVIPGKRFVGCLIAALVPLACAAQDGGTRLSKRHGFEYAPELYPQATPQEALASVVKAIDRKNIDYLLAHLADPEFVDERVVNYAMLVKGDERARLVLAFERLVRETTQHFREDPLLVKELRQFLKEADWEVQDQTAVGVLKTPSPRRVFFRKLENRWFLENRQQ
ncbi:MAG: hypothetical protein NZO58_03155 [Gemmataceae bacterium]|nr:hypothetical protein [Gemmataceae bacterium]